MSVDIVLATFNGERFIREQLNSLMAQSFADFRILVGDDGSTDRTLEVLAEYQGLFPNRIFLLSTPGGLGASANFSVLLSESTADYVFLSDQDDVWDSNKIAASLDAMRLLEEKYGRNVPLLVHTDLRVVDAELRLIASSFFDFQRLDSGQTRLRDLLFQNVVTGCTVVVNRALISKASPISGDAAVHDWWLALVASAFGHIHFLDRPLLSYRQHSNNQIGAKGWSARYLLGRLAQLSDRRTAADLGFPVIRQANALGERFRRELSADDLSMVKQVADFEKSSVASRIINAAKMRAKKHGLFRTIALYWLLIRADFKRVDSRRSG